MDEPKRIHVYPVFTDEPAHEVDGAPCWCEPVEWPEDGGVIVLHRRTQ